MMKILWFSILAYFLFGIHIHAKIAGLPVDTTLEKLATRFENNRFPIKEAIHLQLNKSLYLTSETIFFNIYLVNAASRQPSVYSLNIHTELLNHQGKLIQNKTWFNDKGTASGSFELDDTLISGYYLIRVYTNLMRNQGPQSYFYTWIEIQSPKKETEEFSPFKTGRPRYTIPEDDIPLLCIADTSQKDAFIYTIDVKNKSRFSTWHALLHANEQFLNSYTLTFEPNNLRKAKMIIPVSNLKPGLNQLVFFDHQMNPIFEKAIWKPLENLVIKPDLSINPQHDSLFIHVQNETSLTGAISILPEATYCNGFHDNIITSIFLPYHIRKSVKGLIPEFISDSAYKINRILSQYSFIDPEWKRLFSDSAFKYKYIPQRGFSIIGNVTYRYSKIAQPGSKVIMVSPANDLFLETKTDKKGRFTFNNLYLQADSSILLTATQENKTFDCHIEAIISAPGPEKNTDMSLYHEFMPTVVKSDTIKMPAKVSRVKYEFIRTIELDDVEIKSKKENPFDGSVNFDGGGFGNLYLVNKEEVKKYQNIEDLLSFYCNLTVYDAFRVHVKAGYFLSGKTVEVGARYGPPLVVIDGTEYKGQQELTALFNLKVAEIEAVYVSRGSENCCMRGTVVVIDQNGRVLSTSIKEAPLYGTIRIKTRSSFLNVEEKKNPLKVAAKKGYNIPSKFKASPIITSLDKNYMPLYWTPLKNSDARFAIPAKWEGSASIYVEGIDLKTGKILHIRQKISLK